MTNPGSYIYQSNIFRIFSAKYLASIPLQAGLASLLVLFSGLVLPTKVYASSQKISQVVVPTTTDQTPTTVPTQPTQVPTTVPSQPVQVPTSVPTTTDQTPTTVPTQPTQVSPSVPNQPIQTPTNPTTAPRQPTQVPPSVPTQPSQVPAITTVVYVNPTTGTDSSSAGNVATPYKTITYAISQAQSGTAVQLAPGNYSSETGETFPLTIPQGVTLRGEPATKGQNTVIIGGGTYISPTFARQNVTVRAEKNTAISGITLTNTNTRGTALWIESTNPTITDNTFANSNRDGIFITGTANPNISANVFTKNSGNGISVARSAQGEIRNNLFQETGFGLAIGGSSSPLVAENQINKNTDGIYISESARPTLRDNVIEDNERDGVIATVNAKPDLGTAESAGNNIIRNNTRNDVFNATRSNTLIAVGNTIDPKRISGKVDLVGGLFADVKDYWAQPYIQALATREIIAGFPDGTFKPNDPVTRAQFAAIVSKAFAAAPQREAVEFKDVIRTFWGYGAIQSAYRGGFVAGYPGGVFQPQQEIPRVQVLVSLANGLKLTSNNSNALSIYTDAAQIPSYATSPVAAATVRQLVINYPTPNQLNPNRPATRAEVAAFVYQALVNTGGAQPIASPYLVRVP